MAKPFARQFYHSKAWHAARRDALAKTGGLCEECMKRGLIVPADEVHHEIELTPGNINNPDISLNLKLLHPLCHKCHDATKHGGYQPRYTIDDQGNVTTKPTEQK